MDETQLRAQTESKVGPIHDEIWKDLVEDRYVEEVLSGGASDELLVKEARKRKGYMRNREQNQPLSIK